MKQSQNGSAVSQHLIYYSIKRVNTKSTQSAGEPRAHIIKIFEKQSPWLEGAF
jgi:hypothetical protein